jgi:hypothetical protein
MTQPLGNCPGCGGDEPFEPVHPPRTAADLDTTADLDMECTEWVCSACGAGVFMGTVLFGGGSADTSAAGTGAAAIPASMGAPARLSARAA